MADSDERESCLLVGVDGSETSLRAGAYAAGMAKRLPSRLVCLFVHTTSGLTAITPAAAGMLERTQQEAYEELQSLVTSQRPYLDIDIEIVERSGNPYRELVNLADELHVDAVVVGASTQAGHRLVGSLAVHLVRDARWPVIVVP